MKTPFLDQGILKSLLSYDPETGMFVWLSRASRTAFNTRFAGKRAGYVWRTRTGRSPYRNIRIHDWPFLEHRLAFLYMTGEWPPEDVDHIDMDGLNNRWSNLRLATKGQNSANTLLLRTNTSGKKGVSHSSKRNGRYRAYIRMDGRQKNLGYFGSVDEASAAYEAALKAKYGEFARL